jgi:hypothetical protein
MRGVKLVEAKNCYICIQSRGETRAGQELSYNWLPKRGAYITNGESGRQKSVIDTFKIRFIIVLLINFRIFLR